ncbi:uncharacterized protein [Salvelinus alpinus]|uniref:uncharacterized protein n=1 Tax=Salvelinus alpinus TaxID=8036 RepID=UPI0039FD143C
MAGSLAPVMYWAVRTTLCSALRSEAEQYSGGCSPSLCSGQYSSSHSTVQWRLLSITLFQAVFFFSFHSTVEAALHHTVLGSILLLIPQYSGGCSPSHCSGQYSSSHSTVQCRLLSITLFWAVFFSIHSTVEAALHHSVLGSILLNPQYSGGCSGQYSSQSTVQWRLLWAVFFSIHSTVEAALHHTVLGSILLLIPQYSGGCSPSHCSGQYSSSHSTVQWRLLSITLFWAVFFSIHSTVEAALGSILLNPQYSGGCSGQYSSQSTVQWRLLSITLFWAVFFFSFHSTVEAALHHSVLGSIILLIPQYSGGCFPSHCSGQYSSSHSTVQWRLLSITLFWAVFFFSFHSTVEAAFHHTVLGSILLLIPQYSGDCFPSHCSGQYSYLIPQYSGGCFPSHCSEQYSSHSTVQWRLLSITLFWAVFFSFHSTVEAALHHTVLGSILLIPQYSGGC